MPARRLAPILLLALAGVAEAQTIATSPGPDRVAVTVYRDPNRTAAQPPNLRWLNGYALISETRRVRLPAGESELRFEGVAGGILPQSAIVTGLPEGVIERNRDAYLLSPATLLDRSLGARVHLRRTSRATGRVREQDAIVRSGATGAVILESEGGIEALRCTGLPETLVYDRVPPGLSARPTLSVRARSARAASATVTLSYLASGFDWQANYVAALSRDGTALELFGWLTLASMDETSFRNADTQAVAGRLNRTHAAPQPSEGGPLTIRCWPQGTTSDIPLREEEEQVVVTGSRIAMRGMVANAPMMAVPSPPPPPPPMQAVQEELGDLKLYRIPEPVTVAARSQKQVALLQRAAVRVAQIYRRRVYPGDRTVAAPARRLLVTRNRAAEGLGLPLPAGRLMLFSQSGPRRLLIGQGTVADRAVGEDVEIELGPAPGVRSTLTLLARHDGISEYELVVTNDQAEPVRFEAEILAQSVELTSAQESLPRRNGMPLWAVTVPANGSATLRYELRAPAR
ncbi:MAG TPA: hypothetical protein VGW40_02230 [Allosphingosinicella sp.]|nr:hypothetical protein [Allosphingosinicella sp.]